MNIQGVYGGSKSQYERSNKGQIKEKYYLLDQFLNIITKSSLDNEYMTLIFLSCDGYLILIK